MELRQVKGNTWVLDSWELIPLYKLDAHRCVLLDTGTWDQRDELEAALDAAGLDPVAILQLQHGGLWAVPGAGHRPRSLAYFEQASQNYLNYLTDQGWLALEIQENTLVYRKVSVPGDRPLVKLPPTGWFCDNRPVRREDIWNWNK